MELLESSSPCIGWDVDMVVQWLTKSGLSDVAPLFIENDIDGDLLFDLRDENLKEIGIASVGKRMKVLKRLKELEMATNTTSKRTDSYDNSLSSTTTVAIPESTVDVINGGNRNSDGNGSPVGDSDMGKLPVPRKPVIKEKPSMIKKHPAILDKSVFNDKIPIISEKTLVVVEPEPPSLPEKSTRTRNSIAYSEKPVLNRQKSLSDVDPIHAEIPPELPEKSLRTKNSIAYSEKPAPSQQKSLSDMDPIHAEIPPELPEKSLRTKNSIAYSEKPAPSRQKSLSDMDPIHAEKPPELPETSPRTKNSFVYSEKPSLNRNHSLKTQKRPPLPTPTGPPIKSSPRHTVFLENITTPVRDENISIIKERNSVLLQDDLEETPKYIPRYDMIESLREDVNSVTLLNNDELDTSTSSSSIKLPVCTSEFDSYDSLQSSIPPYEPLYHSMMRVRGSVLARATEFEVDDEYNEDGTDSEEEADDSNNMTCTISAEEQLILEQKMAKMALLLEEEAAELEGQEMNLAVQRAEYLMGLSAPTKPPRPAINYLNSFKDHIIKIEVGKRAQIELRQDELTNPSYSGWLMKRGEKVKSWRRRWCILKNFVLYYQKVPGDKKALGKIVLPGYCVGACDIETKKTNSFRVTHSNMRSYYFYAEDEQQSSTWMRLLQRATALEREEEYESFLKPISAEPLKSDSAISIDGIGIDDDCISTTNRTATSNISSALPNEEKNLIQSTGRFAIAIYDNEADDDDELAFTTGDRIFITNCERNDWWIGVLNGQQGLVVRDYLVWE